MTTVSNPVNHTQNRTAGKVLSWSKTSFGIKGKTELGNFEISTYADSTIRVRMSRMDEFSPNPYSVIAEEQACIHSLEEINQQLVIKTGKIILVLNLNQWAIKFMDHDGNVLNEDDPSFGISWLGTEVTNYKKLQGGEKFIGLGEKTGGLNRAGQAFTNWNTDYFAYGTSDDPLYMSIPFYMGIHHQKAYGIFMDNTYKSVFNFGASNRRFSYFSADDGDMDYYFIHDDTISKIISAYSHLTGTMEMPPLWSLGYQQCRYSYYPESEVKTLAQTFRDKDMPADVIYLDIHHMENYKVFTFDKKNFPDPKSLIQHLKAKGFRVVVIMDPGIKVEETYEPYQEGEAQNLFVKYPDGEIYEGQVWPGWCAFPDFTAEKTRIWWAEKMAYYTDLGVDGFWTDMNEPASWGQHTPNLINFDYEGEQVSHRKARNIYGMQMARAAQEGAKHQGQQRPFVLTRAGFAGIQRHAAAWTGDNVSSEEHMLAGIRLVNSLGISGVPFAGYDVGGFCGEASKSLFARWMSIATFSPLFRAHSMINSNDAEPWAFGEEVEEIAKTYMKLRYRLLPFIYAAFRQSSLTGLPIVKSLVVDFPFDHKVFDGRFENQYLFGESLLVIPVESTKNITKAYLPEGNWYHLFTGEAYAGNQEVYLDCPINYLPVMVKGGSIIPMQSAIAHTGETPESTLSLHLFAGETTGTFHYYEDDGNSLDYQNGDYFQRKIHLDSKQSFVHFEKVEGSFSSKFEEIELIFHGFDISEASVEDSAIDISQKEIAFLDKISDFDPLPDNSLPYYTCGNKSTLRIPNSKEAFTVKFN